MRLLFVLLVILGASPALAEDGRYADVIARGTRLPKLAVEAPHRLGPAAPPEIAKELSDVAVFDMNMAGLVTAEGNDQPARSAGISMAETDFLPWMNYDFLLRTAYDSTGEDLTVEFRLYDVVNRTLMTAKRYLGKKRDLRRFSHAFADEIMLTMTGEKGCFTTRIAFVSTQTRNKEIAIMDWDGHNPLPLTRNGSINLNPDFSPDGREIIFTTYRNNNPDLYKRALSSTGEVPVSRRPGLNATGAWSPDGARIALVLSKDGNSEIYTIARDGGDPIRLTTNQAIEVSPAWSPDGSHIAFVSDRLGKPQIFVTAANGGSVRRLTTAGNYNVTPRWSPKGGRIAYARMVGNGFQIFTINADGSGDTQLTDTGSNENPAWSPDGRFIAFSSKRNGSQSIYVMRADGSGQTRVGQVSGNSSQPAWSPR
ncbi:Tol-Pal system beta propeller repeat protein TolB [Geobacter sp. SVR]|uniref:Tol-Pal system beta propeller repeat protein TolB n=1 Tax=Geobacter sp. SVR TaxID=2495594 RepID=UPI00143F0242|nr:Tol-Pal system beta propeller repeat protein TolB [Geobacter sp. SVR]BCS56078.1 protein TolB [Geobacter sp. SVR]GCF84841.1 protein TolB [Geobacter sp. SVR]